MGTSKQVLVRASGLRYVFDDHVAVEGLDLSVRRGEVLGLLGPNGAGKSTTLRLLTGTLTPTSGSISICDRDLVEQPLHAKRHIGFLPERPPLYPELTVEEYLTHCARLRRVPAGSLRQAVDEAKQRCGLEANSRRMVGNLSLGYKQRVGIAQAIVHRPEVVILDEPTIGLDPVQIREVRDLLKSLAVDGALILSSHVLSEVESVCTHVQIMHRGRSVLSAPMSDLSTDGNGPMWFRISLRRPPDADALRDVAGVAEVESLGDGASRVLCEDQGGAIDALVDAAHRQGWELVELTPERHKLEQIFLASVLEPS